MSHQDQWVETQISLRDPLLVAARFPSWCEVEFSWDAGDTEEVPFAAREAYEDHAFAGREPKYARHPDLGWIVTADHAHSDRRTVVWHESTLRDLLTSATRWATA